ncbi:MAG: C1 family peptidase [candidate division WOR-3 bacterium]
MYIKIARCLITALALGVWGLDCYSAFGDDTKTYRAGTKLLFREYQKDVEVVHDVAAERADALPTMFDWGPLASNPFGRNITDPVRDQGNCGSCWAFATVGWMEAVTNVLLGTTVDLSEEVLVSACCPAGDCDGGYIDEASDWLKRIGTTTEACWPYTASDGPCSGYCSSPMLGRIGSWAYASGNWYTINIAAIRQALVSYGPIVVGMDVYSDFMRYAGGVYRHTTGTLEGGHAVLITGYVDDPGVPGGGFFIVKNSWGADWGPYGGYFAVAYDSNCYFGIEATYYQGFIY